MTMSGGWDDAGLPALALAPVASVARPDDAGREEQHDHHPAASGGDLLTVPGRVVGMNLQDLVDELAETLDRSIVINDPAFRPIVASAQGDEIDELRARALLRRVTPPRERAYVESLRLTQSRRPRTVDLAEFGAHERLAVPIWSDDTLLGILWLITGGLPPLREEQFRALDAAVDVVRTVLAAQTESTALTARDGVMRSLLAADPIARRDALSMAVRAHGVTRDADTLVRAVAIGHDTGVVQRAALGRAVESATRSALVLIGEIGAALLFLGRRGETERLDAAVIAEAERAGVLLRAIGAAGLSDADNDLHPVAERAIATATVAELLPELGRSLHADDVGPWLLISDVLTDPRRLSWYSPAAFALVHDADPLRRQTVEALLDNAGHVRQVCEVLHIHRTTLYYRLENMPQVVRDALDDGMQRSALHLGLKLAAYWENAGHIR